MERRIAAIARSRHGIVTLDQLQTAGVSKGQLRSRVVSGALVLVAPGVYRLAGAPRTWEQRALESCLTAGAGAILVRRAAGTVWRLDLPEPKTIDVAVLHTRHHRTITRQDMCVRRIRTLDAVDRTHVGSLPVTTLGRTLVDLAAVLQPAVLHSVLDDALSRRLTRPHQVDKVLQRLGGEGRAGFAHLRDSLAPWLAGEDHGSVAEADCRRLLAAHGLPAPTSQHRVVCQDGRVFVLDFAWPEAGLALEVDGFRWHASPAAHAGDAERANQLAALGWIVLRVTPTELRTRPHAILTALRRHLASA